MTSQVLMGREAVFAAFRRAANQDAEAAAYAPGRVNLIGEHTDYNDGFVLPAAVDRGVAVAARRVSGDTFILHAIDLGKSCAFPKGALKRDPDHSWADYFKGVVWALLKRGIDVPTCEAAITGDIPQGAGLSSSAAYEVATVLLLRALGGFELSSLEVAKVAREAENGFVGVAGGIMDQMASLLSIPGHLMRLDCRDLSRTFIPFQHPVKLYLCDSQVERALAADARVVGVNHRDLRTFQMDMTLASSMRPFIPSSRLLVAESGIRTADDVRRMQAAGIDAVLVGGSLMCELDPGAALRKLLGGP